VNARHFFSATLLLFALIFAGCFLPMNIAVSPHVAGRVLDADTKRPIDGATLQFEHFRKSPVTTGANGSFDIPEVQALRSYPVPLPDFYGSSWQHLIVRATGYERKQLSYPTYKSHVHETILLKHS
jgi:hypothetical protein